MLLPVAIENVYILMLYYCFRLHNSWYTYTIHFYMYYMFRPDVTIFSYIESHNHLFLFLLLSPTLVSVYTLGVRYMCGFM
jgi:hypothetical protein